MSKITEEILKNIKISMKNIKEITPLTHCITNFVTVNDCANATLAVGGSPIMADDAEEVAEIVNIANVLVINIGKLNEGQIEAMRESAKEANKTKTPIVLDPVGAGISNLRNRITKELVENYTIAAIRGNMSEIKAIANLIKPEIVDSENTEGGKGVDVAETDIINKKTLKVNGKIVNELANELNTNIIASGPIDIASNGKTTIAIENGDEMMPLITGSGCMLSTIIGSYIGSNEDYFLGGITGSLVMSIAGENAAKYVKDNNLGTGTFRTSLINNLYKINSEEIKEKANIYEINFD